MAWSKQHISEHMRLLPSLISQTRAHRGVEFPESAFWPRVGVSFKESSIRERLTPGTFSLIVR